MDGVKTIGLTGGIASGKTAVAEILGELGAQVLDADRLGHTVLAENPDVQESIRRRWGAEVFDSQGRVDRHAVARRVFAPGLAGEDDRKFLESLVHPKIRELLFSGQKRLADEGFEVIVVDAALLFETGWNEVCDLVVFVDAARDLRLERARRRAWTDDQFSAREAAQWPAEHKRQRANFVITNDGSLDDLRRKVQAFWDRQVP